MSRPATRSNQVSPVIRAGAPASRAAASSRSGSARTGFGIARAAAPIAPMPGRPPHGLVTNSHESTHRQRPRARRARGLREGAEPPERLAGDAAARARAHPRPTPPRDVGADEARGERVAGAGRVDDVLDGQRRGTRCARRRRARGCRALRA